MKTRIIDTNKYLTQNNFLRKIAEAAVASFKLEGIHLSIEDALNMVHESPAAKAIAQKK